MALTPSEAAALANKLLAEVKGLTAAQIIARLVVLDNPEFNPTSPYPTGFAYVSADGSEAILVNIAAGQGGAFIAIPPQITGIDLLNFRIFANRSGLTAAALRGIESAADYVGELPGFENLSYIFDGTPNSFVQNAATLAALGDTLTNYFNGLVGAPPDYAKTVAELRGLLDIQTAVAFNDQRQAVGTEFRDVLTSRGDGRKEILTGFLGADAFYIEELDFLTGKNKLNTKKVVTSIDDYNAQQGDHVFVSLSELKKMAPGFTEIKFATAFTKKQLKKLAKSGNNFIYYTGSGDLYFDANESRKDFGNGGQIARFDLNEGLRPILSSADFSLF